MTGSPQEPLLLAGYVLTRLAKTPPGLSTVPRQIITVSDCIMDDLPRPELWDWFQSRQEVDACEGDRDNTELVEVALSPIDARTLIAEMGGPAMPYFDLLRTSIVASGDLIGFEVVGVEATLDLHSWHCHGYADEVVRDLGIRVNDLGLLATYEDAVGVLDWMLARPADEAPAPVPWTVVALLRTSQIAG